MVTAELKLTLFATENGAEEVMGDDMEKGLLASDGLVSTEEVLFLSTVIGELNSKFCST